MFGGWREEGIARLRERSGLCGFRCLGRGIWDLLWGKSLLRLSRIPLGKPQISFLHETFKILLDEDLVKNLSLSPSLVFLSLSLNLLPPLERGFKWLGYADIYRRRGMVEFVERGSDLGKTAKMPVCGNAFGQKVGIGRVELVKYVSG